MVRVAVVGIGGYGGGLIEALQRMSEPLDCRLVAAADARLPALAKQATALSKAGVELFDDALRMFDALHGNCDAVYIASSIPTHAPLCIAAARAGFHVHLEKPPAATVQEVDAMLTALDAAGRFCLVGFQALHAADIRFIKDRVVAGRLGRVKTLACHAGWPRNRAYYARNDWAGKLRCGDTWVLDGPATNALAHQITNLLFLASSEPNRLATPMSVRAELYAAGEVESHDTAAIEIRTAEGPAAYFLASHCSEANFGPIIEIEAERGKVLWTTRDGATITYTHGHPPDVPRSACPTVSPPPARTDTAGQASRGTARSATESCPAADGRDKMVANFIEAVRANDPSLLRCPLSETRAFVLALDAAHESSRSIHRISPDHTRQVGDGAEARTIVTCLDGLLPRAAANRQLFSGPADRPPWVTATEAFPLAGYSIFPQRFGLE